jgi:hypothetical protein
LFDSVDRNLCGERPFRLPAARLKCGVWLGGLGDFLPGLYVALPFGRATVSKV